MTNQCSHETEWRMIDTLPCPWCVIDELKRNRDNYRAAYNRIATAARNVTTELQKVGDETAWKDGDETDRIFAWYEMRPLVDALNTDIHLSGEPRLADEPSREPERPFGWFRMDGGKVVFAMGYWPPPEPDDTPWSPLYSSPAGRPSMRFAGPEGCQHCGAGPNEHHVSTCSEL